MLAAAAFDFTGKQSVREGLNSEECAMRVNYQDGEETISF